MRHRNGSRLANLTLLGTILIGVMAQAPAVDALTRAHQAYNAGRYDMAIVAAREAMKQPARSNAAALVLARAFLDRYKAAMLASDLDDARAALAEVRPADLSPRDHVDFLIAQGLLLYHDGCGSGCFGTAAEFFGQALDRVTNPELGDRDLIFEWWAASLDRHALYTLDADRAATYGRVLERAERERSQQKQSTSAAYWLAAAARGAGDLDRAWSSAISGWINAKTQGPRGEKLRADLDYLISQVVLPERAKLQVLDGDARTALATMLKEWDELMAKYR